MIYVKVREDEPFEKALRKFKNKWIKAGILREVRARSYYLKPSEARKIAKRSKRKQPSVNLKAEKCRNVGKFIIPI